MEPREGWKAAKNRVKNLWQIGWFGKWPEEEEQHQYSCKCMFVLTISLTLDRHMTKLWILDREGINIGQRYDNIIKFWKTHIQMSSNNQLNPTSSIND